MLGPAGVLPPEELQLPIMEGGVRSTYAHWGTIKDFCRTLHILLNIEIRTSNFTEFKMTIMSTHNYLIIGDNEG